MKTRIILLLAIIATITAEELPSTFRTCKRSDTKCLLDAGRDAIVSMANGIKEFKIPSLEPLMIDNMKFGEVNGPVSVTQEYQNVILRGLTKDISLHDFDFDWDKLILSFNIFIPSLELIADYKISGKLLLLPLTGEGKCNITTLEVSGKHKIHFEKLEKNGETYLKVTKYSLQFLPKSIYMYFGNLFGGDPALGTEMNKFMNENSEVIFKELAPGFEESFGRIFFKITNDIFLRVPINKIFPPT